MSKKKSNIKASFPETSEYKGIAFYFILICGIIICLAGIYLIITNNYAVGFTTPNRYSGELMGGSIVNGTFTLIVGLIFCIIGIYNLPKRIKK